MSEQTDVIIPKVPEASLSKEQIAEIAKRYLFGNENINGSGIKTLLKKVEVIDEEIAKRAKLFKDAPPTIRKEVDDETGDKVRVNLRDKWNKGQKTALLEYQALRDGKKYYLNNTKLKVCLYPKIRDTRPFLYVAVNGDAVNIPLTKDKKKPKMKEITLAQYFALTDGYTLEYQSETIKQDDRTGLESIQHTAVFHNWNCDVEVIKEAEFDICNIKIDDTLIKAGKRLDY